MPASKAQQAISLERDEKAIRLRAKRWTWQQIADELGYSSRGAAERQVTRRLRQRGAVMAESADALLQQELAEIDLLAVECYRVLDAARPEDTDEIEIFRSVIEFAKRHGDNPDDWPIGVAGYPSIWGNDEMVLKAVDRLAKLNERRTRLLGLDKVKVEGGLTVTIEGLDGMEGP